MDLLAFVTFMFCAADDQCYQLTAPQQIHCRADGDAFSAALEGIGFEMVDHTCTRAPATSMRPVVRPARKDA